MPDLTPFDCGLLHAAGIAAEPIPDTRILNPEHECVEQNVILTLEDYQRLAALAEQGDPEGWRRIAGDYLNTAQQWREEYRQEALARVAAEEQMRLWRDSALGLAVILTAVAVWVGLAWA